MMEINNKKRILKSPTNLSNFPQQKNNLSIPKRQNKQQTKNNTVTSCNLSRIADYTQRTQFKEQESILNDFSVLLNSKRDIQTTQYPKDYKYLNRRQQQNGNRQNQHNDFQQFKQNENLTSQFNQKYAKVLQMLAYPSQSKNQQSYTLLKAFQYLTFLIQTLKSKNVQNVNYQLAQNIVLNFWKVCSDLFFIQDQQQNQKQQQNTEQNPYSKEKQKVLMFINETIPVLQELCIKQNIKYNKLSIICLILAKQYFRQKDMAMALQSCQKGFKYCPKFKNASLLLKLHYLKSKIYNFIKAYEPEFQQIKKSIFFLKNISNNATQNKQFGYELMKTLIKRRQQLKNIVQNKSLGPEPFKFYKSIQKPNQLNKNSLTKFRKKSISLSKLKVFNDEKQIKNQNNNKKSIQKNLPSTNSAYNLINNHTKKDFLKLDINRNTKLKKKGQTLTIWQKNSQKLNFQNKISKQLQKICNQNHQNEGNLPFKSLLLRRPNDLRKQSTQTNQQNNKEKDNLKLKLKQYNHQKKQAVKKIQQNVRKQNIKIEGIVKNQQLQNSVKNQPKEAQQNNVVQQDNYKNNYPDSDSELIRYINSVQQQILDRFLYKLTRNSHKKQDVNFNQDQIESDTNQKEQPNTDALPLRGSSKKDANIYQPLTNQCIKITKKNSQFYDQNVILEQSYNSKLNSCTHKQSDDQDLYERIFFQNIISKSLKNNQIITFYGVISQLSLQISKKKSAFKISSPLSQQKIDYIFYIETVCDGQYYQIEMTFQKISNSFKKTQNLQIQVLQWLQKEYENSGIKRHSANREKTFYSTSNGQNVKQVENKKNKQKRTSQSFALTQVQKFIINKIINNLSKGYHDKLGYRILKQRHQQKGDKIEFNRQNKQVLQIQRLYEIKESIFEYRQKNFQYVNLFSDNDTEGLLNVDWKYKQNYEQDQTNQINNHNSKRNVQLQQQNHNNGSNQNPIIQQSQLNKFKMFFFQINKSYNQLYSKNDRNYHGDNNFEIQKLHQIDHMNLNQTNIYYPTYSLNKYTISHQIFNQDKFYKIYTSQFPNTSCINNNIIQLTPPPRIISKNQYINSFKDTIIGSAFPKFKYLQLKNNFYSYLSQLNIQKEVNYDENQDQNQGQSIRLVATDKIQSDNKKKGSLRKSQLIQFEQNLNKKSIRESQLNNLMIQNLMNMQQKLNQTQNHELNFKQSSNKLSSKQQSNHNPPNPPASILKQININQHTHFQNIEIQKILKRALIQPQYNKSHLLITYFDSISVSSYSNIMGLRPNYIKLTCFRMKTIYIEQEQKMSYFYLFEMQQREARTRMHKFIIGDKEIKQLVKRIVNFKKSITKESYSPSTQSIFNKQNIIRTNDRHTKTLPYKNKTITSQQVSKQQILSNDNKQKFVSNDKKQISGKDFLHDAAQKQKTKERTFKIQNKASICQQFEQQKQFKQQFAQKGKQSGEINRAVIKEKKMTFFSNQSKYNSIGQKNIDRNGQSISNPTQSILKANNNSTNLNKQKITNQELQLKFNQQSLTEIIKFISPFLVIKKNYLYTSVYLQYGNNLFYMMNKFNIAQQEFFDSYIKLKNEENHVKVDHEKTIKNNILYRNEIYQVPRNLQIRPNFNKKDNYTRYSSDFSHHQIFINKQIKAKKILCQTSLILQVSQNFVHTFAQTKNRNKNTKIQKNPVNQYQNLISLKSQYDPSTNSQIQNRISPQKQGLNKLFSVLTIIKIQKSRFFTIKLYIPKFQRSYTLTLDVNFINQMKIQDLKIIFKDFLQVQNLIEDLNKIQQEVEKDNTNVQNKKQNHMHRLSKNLQIKQKIIEGIVNFMFQEQIHNQKLIWTRLLKIIKIQQRNTEDKVYLIMKISNFQGFIKDSSLIQFIQKDNSIFMLEITMNRKSEKSHYFPKDTQIKSFQGQIVKRGILTSSKKKQSQKRHKISEQSQKNKFLKNKIINPRQINEHNQQFKKISSIYESKTQKYMVYVQIFKIYDHKNNQKSTQNNTFNSRTNQLTSGNLSKFYNKDLINGSQETENNMFQNESEGSFQAFKSHQRFVRNNTIKRTAKSTVKSINLNMKQKMAFKRNKRLKSNYKALNNNTQKQKDQQFKDIRKINFSFYLSQLNDLFKCIDKKYSQEFNQQFFVLSQMQTGFKILKKIVIDEFNNIGKPYKKNIKRETINRNKKYTINRPKKGQSFYKRWPGEQQNQKLSSNNEQFSQVQIFARSNVEGLIGSYNGQLSNENQMGNKNVKGFNLDYKQAINYKKERTDEIKNLCSLFSSFKCQRIFKRSILQKLNYFKLVQYSHKQQDHQSQRNNQKNSSQIPNFTNRQKASSKIQMLTYKSKVGSFKQKSQILQSSIDQSQMSHIVYSKDQTQNNLKSKVLQKSRYNKNVLSSDQTQQKSYELMRQNQMQKRGLKYNQIKDQSFTSLHNKLSNSALIDLHLLPNSKSSQISSLFYKYDSLLFNLSNVQSYQIFTVSVKLQGQHPFSFIQILQEKQQLPCIRDRLFKFYKNLLILMSKKNSKN